MTLQRLFQSLSLFIKYASKNPLWAFGWFVFITISLPFVINFFVDYPNQQAQMDNNSARFNTYTQDYDESAQVVQILRDSNKSFIAVIEQYNIISKKIAGNENISQDDINKAMSEAKDARIFLSKSYGTLKGITFNDATLDKYVQGFSANIGEKERITGSVIDFYQGGLSQDKQKINDAITVLQNYSIDLYQQESETTERLENFMDDFNNFNAKNMIEINDESNKLVIYSWRSKLVVLAMAYSIIFPIFGAFVWIKNSRFIKKNGTVQKD